jgi:hypothetical protein
LPDFQLTNRQREYFGLQPVEEGWDQVPLKDLVLFFDGDVIRKVIVYEHSQQFGYSEFDYELATASREKLLPSTSRGKPKPLTPGNVLGRKELGFSFVCHFGWKGKTFDFQHLYVTHSKTDETIVSLEDHGITTYEQLSHWVQEFIDSCPDDHLDSLDKLRDKKRRRVRYRPGDVFEIPFDNGQTGYGRILLDVYRLRRTGLFDEVPYCGLGDPILGSGLLVEIYSYAGSPLALEATAEQPVLRTKYMMHDDIYRGRFEIAGNRLVEASDLDFPEGVIARGSRSENVEYHFMKGGMTAQFEMTHDEYFQTPKIGCAFGLDPTRIFDAVNGDTEALRILSGDLRYSDRRAEILSRCDLEDTMTYSEMVALKGGIPPEEFITRSRELM